MLIVIILFILGLCIGSFLNALEYRLEEEKTLEGRSFCPNCKHQLAWYDLVPVFSWLGLKGKCRYCEKPISIQYPLIELITAFSFAAFGYASGLATKLMNLLVDEASVGSLALVGTTLIILLTIVSIFILIALYDLKTGYILSKYVYIAIILTLIYLVLTFSGQTQNFITHLYPYLLSAVIPAGIFFLIYFLSKEKWMGAGDTELAFLIGLFLGWPNILVALYFAFIVGAIWGLVKIFLFKKAKMNSEVPFAPFLIAGTFFAYFFGQQLIGIYVRIFLGG